MLLTLAGRDLFGSLVDHLQKPVMGFSTLVSFAMYIGAFLLLCFSKVLISGKMQEIHFYGFLSSLS